MKKIILILLSAILILSCKDKKNKQEIPNDLKQKVVVDVNSICYEESFIYDILVTHNDGKQDTLKGLTEQPNVSECSSFRKGKWCLYDDETDDLLAVDVKSFKVLKHKFDTTEYIICVGEKRK